MAAAARPPARSVIHLSLEAVAVEELLLWAVQSFGVLENAHFKMLYEPVGQHDET